jgi:glycosyltransferase involved in cell wall biosynthesis
MKLAGTRKLIIQIPCFNEEESIGATLAALPRHVDGFHAVETLVIDDGSRDGTVRVAREAGVDHLVLLPHHQGLARAFMAGLEGCLKAGADVIVNTDADNQYSASSIGELVKPIADGSAQMVVGARPISEIREFSLIKKLLQRLGSAVVRVASGTRVPDAASGFRALHRDAAMRLYVYGNYTYTLETIIQAGRKNLPVASVPVDVNAVLRPSRLLKSTASYLYQSVLSILRIFVLYKPLRFFLAVGTLFLLPGLLIGARFLYLYTQGDGAGHIQSLILTAVLLLTAIIVFAVGLLADLTAANRAMLEEIRMRLLRREMRDGPDGPS